MKKTRGEGESERKKEENELLLLTQTETVWPHVSSGDTLGDEEEKEVSGKKKRKKAVPEEAEGEGVSTQASSSPWTCGVSTGGAKEKRRVEEESREGQSHAKKDEWKTPLSSSSSRASGRSMKTGNGEKAKTVNGKTPRLNVQSERKPKGGKKPSYHLSFSALHGLHPDDCSVRFGDEGNSFSSSCSALPYHHHLGGKKEFE